LSSAAIHPIDVKEITKRYGDFTAVDRVSFHVQRGSIFGLLGPNGAGKTTTIRMIMNIIVPDSGSISVMGQPSTGAASRLIGYLPEERGLYRKMKVLDHLVFLGEIRGLKRSLARQRASEWLERLSLGEWSGKKVEELSKGMQQKLQFIGCVIHEPEVLILDEPFSGLDPVNTRVLKDLFVEFRERGRTLIISTHVMEQAEKLCDEIALINRARLVLQGSIAEVKRRYSGNKLQVSGRGAPAALRGLRGVRSVIEKDGGAEVELEPSFKRGDFLREATALFDVDSAIPHEASLDEIFVRVVNPASAGTDPVPGDS
jgi:ABC-2 type transport system ATP-binding protein